MISPDFNSLNWLIFRTTVAGSLKSSWSHWRSSSSLNRTSIFLVESRLDSSVSAGLILHVASISSVSQLGTRHRSTPCLVTPILFYILIVFDPEDPVNTLYLTIINSTLEVHAYQLSVIAVHIMAASGRI